ncbi:MAG: aminotransferase class IV [Candidatus Omnitrophica bacterium]|nr:aminotransferase class IV [Candidatus Omnitrophota bacterium]
MPGVKVWINDKLVDNGEARISVFDRGFMFGDGLFETMRSYDGAVFRMREHLERLFGGLTVMKIKCPYDRKYLEDAVYKCLEANGLKESNVRLTVTRGASLTGSFSHADLKPNVVIITRQLELPKRAYERGVAATIAAIRQNDQSPVARLKTLNFLPYIIARMNAKEAGFDDAILLNTRGHVAEGTTANIFMVKHGHLMTPSLDCGILPGVTRGAVLAVAAAGGIKVKEGHFSQRDLTAADEVFLTNSVIELLPVVRIAKGKIGKGEPGELTKRLHGMYREEVARQTREGRKAMPAGGQRPQRHAHQPYRNERRRRFERQQQQEKFRQEERKAAKPQAEGEAPGRTESIQEAKRGRWPSFSILRNRKPKERL